jgi:hypothetical protein
MPCGGKLLGERRWQTLSLSRRVCLAGDTKLVDGNWALWPLKRDIVGTIDGQDYQFHSPVKRHKATERSWWKQPGVRMFGSFPCEVVMYSSESIEETYCETRRNRTPCPGRVTL